VQDKGPEAMARDSEFIAKSFASLRDCVSYVRQEFVEEKFLFRGERTDRFSTTISALDRVDLNDRLPQKCREVIKQCVQHAHIELQEFLDLCPGLAMGFLQHYELPTKLIDFTSSTEVAAYFAAQGNVNSGGLFAVVPRDLESDLAEVQDLSKHSKATRAHRQRGFSVFSKRYKDLKSNDARSNLNIHWYQFFLTEDDKELFSGGDDLLDVCTDRMSGVVQFLIDDFGKMNDWSAKWLADHVVAAPFLSRVIKQDGMGRPTTIELASAGQTGFNYDILVERVNNYRIWSNVYPDVRGRGGFKNLFRITR